MIEIVLPRTLAISNFLGGARTIAILASWREIVRFVVEVKRV